MKSVKWDAICVYYAMKVQGKYYELKEHFPNFNFSLKHYFVNLRF